MIQWMREVNLVGRGKKLKSVNPLPSGEWEGLTVYVRRRKKRERVRKRPMVKERYGR